MRRIAKALAAWRAISPGSLFMATYIVIAIGAVAIIARWGNVSDLTRIMVVFVALLAVPGVMQVGMILDTESYYREAKRQEEKRWQ